MAEIHRDTTVSKEDYGLSQDLDLETLQVSMNFHFLFIGLLMH